MSLINFMDYDYFNSVRELYHYGVAYNENPPGRGSGRYPHGSGEEPYQHYKDFLTRVQDERRQNVDYIDENGKRFKGDTAIAKRLGVSTTEFRTMVEIANEEVRSVDAATAHHLRYNDDGTVRYSLNEVAKKMGLANDSSVRALLNQDTANRKAQSAKTAEYIKDLVDKNGMYDVGSDAAIALNVSQTKLQQALYRLKLEGYEVYGRGISQVTNTNQQTNTQVICPPGTPYKEVYNGTIHFFHDEDTMLTNNGQSIKKAFEYPASLDPSRVMIRYADDKVSGKLMDGVVEIRRGVEDVSLKNDDGVDSNYAQVRVLVGDTHYIKGMAVYSHGKGWPPGVDMVFNTNKTSDVPMMGDDKNHTVLKKIKDDPQNPFGTLIKDREHGGQSYYTDENGEKHLRVINKKSDEGDWDEWAKKLPAQFLAKQPQKLVDQQIDISIAERKAEFETIKSLTNPVVRREQLASFASDCDSTADKLKTSPLPGQRYQVILPLRSIGDHEVYAPNFPDGSKIALVRFPHEGKFQIPICKVNNKNPEGNKVITKSGKDAIGISANTAEKMSGADFDGDTVLCIPLSHKVKVDSSPTLKALEGFDAKTEYGPDSIPGRKYKHLSKEATQNEMGKISNLITDMTIRGASPDELARAVKYSNTVIDADKHDLDYQRCFKEQRIKELKDTYQGRYNEKGNWSTAASTLITRANAEYDVPKRQGSPNINQKGKPWYDPSKPEGALIYKTATDKKLYYEEEKKRKDPVTKEFVTDPETGRYIYDKTGKTKMRMTESTQMRETDDARTLMSSLKAPVERAYANYANTLKALANEARKEQVYTGNLKKNKSAAQTYAKEVKSLEDQLAIAQRNAPREKQANYIAGMRLKAIRAEYPTLDKKELKKKSDQLLKDARLQVGAKRVSIKISDREWEAIQNGAFSDNKLSQILRYADKDRVKELAMPRNSKELSPAKKNLIRALSKSYTRAELAERFGVSVSTISKYVSE